MNKSDLEYELPPELIASRPLARRSASRMMRLERASDRVEDRRFDQLPELLRPGDLLVVNDTQVINARLLGSKEESGGAIEALLVEPVDERCWWALGKSSRGFRVGAALRFESARATVEEVGEGGRIRLSFDAPVLEVAAREGRIPLPPYIPRPDDADDKARYQTMFARAPGAVAAPTAALHFDAETVAALDSRGVEQVALTLHVGPGTFQPIRVDDLDQHLMEAERFEIPQRVADAIAATRARGGRVVAVGTTCTRALESAADGQGGVSPRAGATELFIKPGHRFQVVDALLTNFHLPGSTLIALVMALAGRELIRRAYRRAVEQGYRFYSYGDCMLIE